MTSTDAKRPGRKLVLHAIALFGLLAGVILLDPWIDSLRPASRLALNFAPLLVLYVALFGVLRRALLSAAAIIAPLALLYYINAIKLDELGQPFSIHDFGLTAQLLREVGLFARYSHGAILVFVLLILGTLLAGLVRLEPTARRGLWQVAALATALAAGGLLLSPLAERRYEQAGLYEMAWVSATQARESGLIADLVARSARRVAVRPSRDAERLDEALDLIDPTSTQAAVGRPTTTAGPTDIVIILSESFFDPATLKGLEDCQALPRWCDLRERGITGRITVPTYGGNTTRTEFELLTGVPYASLNKEVYPYNSVVTRATDSIAWAARRASYTTTAIHPHSRTFWNRHQALPLLGFERFITEEDLVGKHQRRGYWIADTALTDLIIERLEAAEAPELIFAISMENHGPWGDGRPGPDEAALRTIPTPAALGAGQARSLRRFIWHARAALVDLDRLVQWIDGRERPTLLLFFGDHLPALDEVFEQAGFDEPGAMYFQPLPFLLLANRPELLEAAGPLPETSHQLGLWMLDRAGVPLSSVQAALLQAHRRSELTERFTPEHLRSLHAEILHAVPDIGELQDRDPSN